MKAKALIALLVFYDASKSGLQFDVYLASLCEGLRTAGGELVTMDDILTAERAMAAADGPKRSEPGMN